MSWGPFDGGATLGHLGSEDGVIVRDEEHVNGARITLERGTNHAPFAVTCGIYGSMFHTARASDQSEATNMFEAMRERLAEMLAAPSEAEYLAMLQRFVDDY